MGKDGLMEYHGIHPSPFVRPSLSAARLWRRSQGGASTTLARRGTLGGQRLSEGCRCFSGTKDGETMGFHGM